MKHQSGFTLLEILFAATIVAILATLASNSFSNALGQSNFKAIRDAGAKVALAQQQHRQRFGQYASQVSATGNTSNTTLVISDAADYSIVMSNASYRDFQATLTPREARLQGTADCWSVRVISQRGYLSYSSLDNQGRDSTERCMPNG